MFDLRRNIVLQIFFILLLYSSSFGQVKIDYINDDKIKDTILISYQNKNILYKQINWGDTLGIKKKTIFNFDGNIIKSRFRFIKSNICNELFVNLKFRNNDSIIDNFYILPYSYLELVDTVTFSYSDLFNNTDEIMNYLRSTQLIGEAKKVSPHGIIVEELFLNCIDEVEILKHLTSVKPKNENTEIIAFPNPVQDELNVSISPNYNYMATLEVIDLMGKRCQINIIGSPSLKGRQNNQFTIDTKSLHRGVYFLLVRINRELIYINKIIKI
ncbi:MAG TPA: T9SS type A sorting domain-containing protein [Candidatus Kapabacteria bacterium]|nr:T9SS type A sorting domain-containing protein [Candidatus Kapabacteria bacterium]